MMNVELNIAGFRFTREIPDRRGKSFASPKFDPSPNPVAPSAPAPAS
jgi:hypothetical protein